MNKTLKTIISIILRLIFWTAALGLLFVGIAGKPLTDWYKHTFNTNFREIIYTFGLGLKGADVSFFREAYAECRRELLLFIAAAAVCLLIILLLDLLDARQRKARGEDRPGAVRAIRLVCRAMILCVGIVLFIPSYGYADEVLNVSGFLKSRFTNTTIYEDNYVSYADASITEPEKQKNLILIYMGSMETTYASKDLGGYQDENLMPELTKMAHQNVSFGDRGDEKLGGTHNTIGTTWTTSAILASESGVPFSFRVGRNQAGKGGAFAENLPTLGDFLRDEGYREMFLCGSDSEFGGKKAYFRQHGDYEIYDYYSAIEDGYIDKDYKVWWGLEDHRLYDIAKDRLAELASSDKPFNLTMLTVDTHHVGGYECEWCPDTYDSKTANVVACADRQIADFISWCKKQDFYYDTVIVILGDHPRMDKKLVKDVDKYEREAYNCFINTDKQPSSPGNRLATTMDLFPTIVSAMGYGIEGDRLGLGTDLFSDKETLAEEMTYDKFVDEIGKNSKFFHKNFDR